MVPDADEAHPHDKADKVETCEAATGAREEREAEERGARGVVDNVVFPAEEGDDEEDADDEERWDVWLSVMLSPSGFACTGRGLIPLAPHPTVHTTIVEQLDYVAGRLPRW